MVKGATREIHVRTLRTGAARNVYRARSGGANTAGTTRPSWSSDGRGLYWARTNIGSNTGNRLIRWDAATGRLTYALFSSRTIGADVASPESGFLVSDAFPGGGCLGNVLDPPEKTECRVLTTGAVSFGARP